MYHSFELICVDFKIFLRDAHFVIDSYKVAVRVLIRHDRLILALLSLIVLILPSHPQRWALALLQVAGLGPIRQFWKLLLSAAAVVCLLFYEDSGILLFDQFRYAHKLSFLAEDLVDFAIFGRWDRVLDDWGGGLGWGCGGLMLVQGRLRLNLSQSHRTLRVHGLEDRGRRTLRCDFSERRLLIHITLIRRMLLHALQSFQGVVVINIRNTCVRRVGC